MARRLIWSPQAVADIAAIAEYIARDSEYYAAAVALRLYEAPDRLLEFPRLGRMVPETRVDPIRELFVHEYRLMYEIAGDQIHILTVVHGRRAFSPEMIEPRPAQPD